jgi:hypothetical protein
MSELSDLDEINLKPDRMSRSYGEIKKRRPIGVNALRSPAWQRELRALRARQARIKKDRKDASE